MGMYIRLGYLYLYLDSLYTYVVILVPAMMVSYYNQVSVLDDSSSYIYYTCMYDVCMHLRVRMDSKENS